MSFVTPDTARRWVRDRLAENTPAADIRKHSWWLGLGDELDAILGAAAPPTGTTTTRKAVSLRQSAAAKPCIHLGMALPNQPGVPCGQKVRSCAEFGEATAWPCARPGFPHCLDAAGRPCCPRYEAD